MRKFAVLLMGGLLLALSAFAAPSTAADIPPSATTFDQAVDRMLAREQQLVKTMEQYSPLVETYIQNMRSDRDLGQTPASDNYYLGRLVFRKGAMVNADYLGPKSLRRRVLEKLTNLYSLHYLPLGFMEMILVDGSSFDRGHYDFTFVRREFLGDVRCLVIDVNPKPHTGIGRFQGRLWVEDQDYNIVRFNGHYTPAPTLGFYLHFDSWRTNIQPGLWLPTYVYSEETDMKARFGRTMRYKSQTRLWAYDARHLAGQQEFSEILVDSPDKVADQSAAAQDASPLQAERLWQRQAEDNVVERLEKAGLLAPPGEVDKVLTTVVDNLEVTNKLNVQPDVRARVLLTAPLESFTIGHTIVLSRGLIDVLPDEAALAAVLAHELGHIVLGHNLDTKYAFSDRMIFEDPQSFQRIKLRHDNHEEADADAKALQLLANSPYQPKLANAGLFLKAVREEERQLPNLLKAHLGDSLSVASKVRMSQLMQGAPQLQKRNLDQIAALPLGARLKLDPWNDSLQLAKFPKEQLLSASEKMPFEITPVYPYLTRLPANDKVANNTGK
ncbi:MAG TPA: M48 family metalloprotease [Terriglobales bacterium]|nr:M48 family metalloprotease [Terriglobales bacterium]